jgi:hypothetical protein
MLGGHHAQNDKTYFNIDCNLQEQIYTNCIFIRKQFMYLFYKTGCICKPEFYNGLQLALIDF